MQSIYGSLHTKNSVNNFIYRFYCIYANPNTIYSRKSIHTKSICTDANRA